ncbi:MAG TPA: hypothetical protein VNT55_23745 [Baekduia sp.]|nr:hypothetical protein [Baekduia sp.]
MTTFGTDGALIDYSVFGVNGSPQALAVTAGGDILVGVRAYGLQLERGAAARWGGDDQSNDGDFAIAR